MPLHEVAAEHDHARHPEKQNLVRGDQQRRRIKHFLIARLLRPAQSRERQQTGRKPRVQYVRILLQLGVATLRTLCRCFTGDDNFPTLAMPRRNPMSPPQLPGNAPVVDVVHPVRDKSFCSSRGRS